MARWPKYTFAEGGLPGEPDRKVRVKSAAVGGAGGFDYVFADADGRKLYIPRGNRVDAYDLDTLKSVGIIESKSQRP
jgi:hypothetical protein